MSHPAIQHKLLFPTITSNEQLMEAKRLCAAEIIAANDAIALAKVLAVRPFSAAELVETRGRRIRRGA